MAEAGKRVIYESDNTVHDEPGQGGIYPVKHLQTFMPLVTSLVVISSRPLLL